MRTLPWLPSGANQVFRQHSGKGVQNARREVCCASCTLRLHRHLCRPQTRTLLPQTLVRALSAGGAADQYIWDDSGNFGNGLLKAQCPTVVR